MVIPGVNGRLYSYREGLGLQELPITAKELVSASPSVTREGATVIVGSQKSTAFLLDPVTGAVLRSFDPLAPPGGGGLSFSATRNDGNEQVDGPLAECLKMAEEEGGEGVEVGGGAGFLEGSRTSGREGAADVQHQQQLKRKRECDRLLASSLLVLRTDYVVRAVELRSGKQRWNVSFGELSPVNAALLGLGGGVGGGVGGGAPIGGVLGGALGAARGGGGGKSGMDLTGRGVFDGHGSGVPNAAASLAVAKRQLLPSSVSGEDTETDIDLGIGAGGHGQVDRDEIGGSGLAGFNTGLTAAATTSVDPSEEGNSDIYSIQLTNAQTGQQAWQTTFSSAPLAAFTPSGRLVQEFVSRDSSKDTGPGQVLYVGRVAGSPFALVTPSATHAPNAALPLLPAPPHSPSDGLPAGMAAGMSGGAGAGGAVVGRTGKFTVTEPPRIAGTRGAGGAAGEAGDGNGGGGQGRGGSRGRGRFGTVGASGSGGGGSGDDSLYPIVVRAPGATAALYDAMGCADSPAVHGGADLAGAEYRAQTSNADMELGGGRGEKNRRLGPPKDMEPAVGPQAPPTPPNLLSSFGILAAAAATLAGIVAGASVFSYSSSAAPSSSSSAAAAAASGRGGTPARNQRLKSQHRLASSSHPPRHASHMNGAPSGRGAYRGGVTNEDGLSWVARGVVALLPASWQEWAAEGLGGGGNGNSSSSRKRGKQGVGRRNKNSEGAAAGEAAAGGTEGGLLGKQQDGPANGIAPPGQDDPGEAGREDSGQGESGGGRLSRLLGSVGKLGSGSRQNSTGKLITRRGSRDNEGPGEGAGAGGADNGTAGEEESEEEREEREDGRWVGRLFVSRRVIGHGSHGTLVLEGRQVAVKRLLSQFYERARQEIAALIATDEHPNVVRCFAMEEDDSFVYVALERCAFNLADLREIISAALERVQAYCTSQGVGVQGLCLWDDKGQPTQQLVGLLRDVASGLAYLHDQRIVHRDLKPHNVLISLLLPSRHRQRGQSQGRVSGGVVSGDKGGLGVGEEFAGSGSSGWQAPEQLEDGSRLTKSVDMFSFGCLVFFCVSGGSHPFGEWFERDANVVAGRADLFPIDHVPEALDLVAALLDRDPEKREPEKRCVMGGMVREEFKRHPFFWPAEQRLAFLRDASDRVEGEDREAHSPLLNALEAVAPRAIARKGGISKAPGEKGGGWNERVDGALLGNLGKYRRRNSYSPERANHASTSLRVSRRASRSRVVMASAAAEKGSAATAGSEELAEFVSRDNRRMLHVVYRVGNLDAAIKFYTECLGMKLLRQRDIPEEKYSNAFLGYGPETSTFVVELTYNYGVDSYDIGAGFGHFGISVDDVYKTVEVVKSRGGKVTREAGPVKGGQSVIAFVEDPSGYKWEIIQRPPTPEPLCQVMLRVGDLDRAIKFYEKAYGMKLLRTRDNPQYKYTIAMVGYGPEAESAVVELTYNYGVESYEKGNAYAQIAIGTDDVYKTAEAIRAAGGTITREPGPIPGINTKIVACLDPDGYKTVFVDNQDFLRELDGGGAAHDRHAEAKAEAEASEACERPFEQPQSWLHRRGKGEWNSGLKDFPRDPRAAALGCCAPCYLFAQTARKITDGRVQFSRAFTTYCLVGGCWGAPLSLILGPFAYWFTCVPCYASSIRRQLRHKKGLHERPMDDFAAHCCCHPCALCQEYRETREFDLELVAGPTHATVDRPPLETARHLEHLQETQQMER
ncbi:unnamed protein product [Closterium sp. Naga37s-1]|nr:unnamed protein product [Closterium sp. Naga37s-1]